MNILVLGWEYPPIISGGLGTATEGLIQGLINLGHKVTLVLPYYPYKIQSENLTIVSPENPYEYTQSNSSSQTNNNLLHSLSTNLINTLNSNSELRSVASSFMYAQTSHYAYNLSDDSLTSEEKEKIKQYLITYSQNILEQELQSSIREQNSFFKNENVYEKTYVLRLLALDILNKNSNFEVVHANDWMTFEALAAVKEHYGNLPLIAHVHSTEFDRSGDVHLNHKILEIEKMGVQIAHRVIAVSQYSKQILIEKFNLSSNKVFVVYNANNKPYTLKQEQKYISTETETKRRPIVTFAGRITFQKGPMYFVHAAKHVIEKIPDTHFQVIGAGDLLNHMKKLVNDLGLSKNFVFEGFLNSKDVQHRLAHSDVFVMPSVSEPFGIVALEAISQKVPVIISKQSGVSEVLNHILKIDFWDTELLADRIMSIIKYPLLKFEMVENSLKDLEQRSWVNSAQKVLTVYEGL